MPLVIFHLKASMDKKTAMSMRKRRVIEHPTPLELTDTGWDSIRVQRSHGTGNLGREIEWGNLLIYGRKMKRVLTLLWRQICLIRPMRRRPCHLYPVLQPKRWWSDQVQKSLLPKKLGPSPAKKGGWAHRMGVIQLSKIKASYHSLTTDGIPTASPTIVVHQTMR